MIKSALTDFKNKIENMSEIETEFEQPNDIGNIVEKILESKTQRGSGFKILTPSQMLRRLPVSSAQLKAGNNSEKLKNKIRQPLYSLYRSKKLTKNIYKDLIDII